MILVLGSVSWQSIYSHYTRLQEVQERHVYPVESLYLLQRHCTNPILLITEKYCGSSAAYAPAVEGKEFERLLQLFQTFQEGRDKFLQDYPTYKTLPDENTLSEKIKKVQQTAAAIHTSQAQDLLTCQHSFILQMHQLSHDFEEHIDSLVQKGFHSFTRHYQATAQQLPFQISLLLFVLLATLLLLWSISFLFIKTLLSSIHTVSKELNDLVSEKADLTKRLAIIRNDEIGQICRNFNQLMDHMMDLLRRIQNAELQVFGSTAILSTSSKQLDATVTHLDSSAKEVVSAASAISNRSQDLVSNLSQLSQVARAAAHMASAGQEGLAFIESTIQKMEGSFQMISAKLYSIEEQSANITTIVATIAKIADQTNMLSLNASIEAEKAGEAGYGFAVIAKETRRLAEQTTMETLDVEVMINEMKTAVTSGVMSIQQFSMELGAYIKSIREVALQQTQIIAHVQLLSPRCKNACTLAQAQAQAAEKIHQSMLQLNQVASDTNRTLTSSHDAIDGLNRAAEELQKESARFKVSRL